MVTTKMNWSGPNVIHFGRKSQFGPDQFILVVTISFWSWPNHYGQVQINFVRPKSFWTNQNCFGHIEGQGISIISHKTRWRVSSRYLSMKQTCKKKAYCEIKPHQNSCQHPLINYPGLLSSLFGIIFRISSSNLISSRFNFVLY